MLNRAVAEEEHASLGRLRASRGHGEWSSPEGLEMVRWADPWIYWPEVAARAELDLADCSLPGASGCRSRASARGKSGMVWMLAMAPPSEKATAMAEGETSSGNSEITRTSKGPRVKKEERS